MNKENTSQGGRGVWLDRARGALLGLAVGDALGAAVEFKAPGTFPPATSPAPTHPR
jgi:hypothetical protein